jgi:hypothetical protein
MTIVASIRTPRYEIHHKRSRNNGMRYVCKAFVGDLDILAYFLRNVKVYEIEEKRTVLSGVGQSMPYIASKIILPRVLDGIKHYIDTAEMLI